MHVTIKEKQTKEVEVIVESYSLCDKCNQKIEKDDYYDAFKCQFIHTMGTSYPNGGSGDEQTMELCNKCVDGFVTLLRQNGYRITDKEWSW